MTAILHHSTGKVLPQSREIDAVANYSFREKSVWLGRAVAINMLHLCTLPVSIVILVFNVVKFSMDYNSSWFKGEKCWDKKNSAYLISTHNKTASKKDLVLVHGRCGLPNNFNRVVAEAKKTDLYSRVILIKVPSNGSMSVDDESDYVKERLESLAVGKEKESFDIVAMSKGGPVAMAMIAKIGEEKESKMSLPDKVVTLASPLRGTVLLSLAPRFIVGKTTKEDLCYQSKILSDLEKKVCRVIDRKRLFAAYAPCDQVIISPDSTSAKNVCSYSSTPKDHILRLPWYISHMVVPSSRSVTNWLFKNNNAVLYED